MRLRFECPVGTWHHVQDANADLRAERDQAVHLLRAIVNAERIERLPGDHAISVVLSLGVDEFLAGLGGDRDA